MKLSSFYVNKTYKLVKGIDAINLFFSKFYSIRTREHISKLKLGMFRKVGQNAISDNGNFT